MACRLSNTISPYWSSHLASLLDGIQYLHKADGCKYHQNRIDYVRNEGISSTYYT